MNIPAAPSSNGTHSSAGVLSQASTSNNNNGTTSSSNTHQHNLNDAKQRRREKKRAAKSKTDSSASGQAQSTAQALAPPRRKRNQLDEENASSRRGGSGSVLWTILVIGLVFCLVDVFYIIGYVDRQQVAGSFGNAPHGQQSVVTESVDAVRVVDNSKHDQANQHIPSHRVGQPIPNHNLPPPPAVGHKFTKTTAGKHQQQPKEVLHVTKELGQVRDQIEGAAGAAGNPNHDPNNDKPPEPVDPIELEAKARILTLIRQAGVAIDLERDADIIRELPTWKDVTDLYGETPHIHGLDTCDAFQNHSDRAEHFVGAAGTFNSGTNLLAELLIANCHMQDRMDKFGSWNRGVRWQVPWGKHTPPGDEKFRVTHKAIKDKDIDAFNVLPAVTIRDPLFWLQSMCKHPYTAVWQEGDHCPDFNPDTLYLKTKVTYSDFSRQHDSILHHWNDYYNEYLTADFPRLLVRYEDLLFHPKELTTSVCECAGGKMKEDGSFKFIVDTAKKGTAAHGSAATRTGYVDAMIKYGNEQKRYAKYVAKRDLEFIRDHGDANLMTLLHYPAADPEKLPAAAVVP